MTADGTHGDRLIVRKHLFDASPFVDQIEQSYARNKLFYEVYQLANEVIGLLVAATPRTHATNSIVACAEKLCHQGGVPMAYAIELVDRIYRQLVVMFETTYGPYWRTIVHNSNVTVNRHVDLVLQEIPGNRRT